MWLRTFWIACVFVSVYSLSRNFQSSKAVRSSAFVLGVNSLHRTLATGLRFRTIIVLAFTSALPKFPWAAGVLLFGLDIRPSSCGSDDRRIWRTSPFHAEKSSWPRILSSLQLVSGCVVLTEQGELLLQQRILSSEKPPESTLPLLVTLSVFLASSRRWLWIAAGIL